MKTAPDFELLVAYETGTITEENFLELFRQVRDTQAYTWLQGHYGRTLSQLQEQGLI